MKHSTIKTGGNIFNENSSAACDNANGASSDPNSEVAIIIDVAAFFNSLDQHSTPIDSVFGINGPKKNPISITRVTVPPRLFTFHSPAIRAHRIIYIVTDDLRLPILADP